MIRKKRALYFFIGLMLSLQACNLPGSQPSQTDLAATITAQALFIQNGQGLSQPAPLASTSNPAFTPTPEFTPTITQTSTPSVTSVTVSENTNCRTGPGTAYGITSALLIGETAEVVGKNTPTNYWIIKTPGDPGSTCWLWGKYATVTGNIAALPEIPIPPTPTPSPTPTLAPPAPVKNLTDAKACIPLPGPLFQYGGAITWEDKSDNEDGFNIYMNGGLFGTVGPNTLAFPLPGIPFPPGTPLTMGVEAFNAAGKSVMKQVIITCP
jgi:hypothetical protein